MAALSDAPGMADRSTRAREDAIKAHAKLRKDDLAAKVATLFEGSHYLPDILVTPVAAGGLSITEEGAALLAAASIAAE